MILENSSGAIRAMGGSDWSQSSSIAPRRPPAGGLRVQALLYLTALEQGTPAPTRPSTGRFDHDRPAPVALPAHELRRQDRDVPQGARALLQRPGRARGADGRALQGHRYGAPAGRASSRVSLARSRRLRGQPHRAGVGLLRLRQPGARLLAVPDRAHHRLQRRRSGADAPGPARGREPAVRVPASADPARGHAAGHGGLGREAEAQHRRKDRHGERLHRRLVHDAALHRRRGRERPGTQAIGKGFDGARTALPIWIASSSR